MKRLAMQNRSHPGITMHKIPIGADFGGVAFTIGTVAICLVAVPEVRYFVVGAGMLGIAIGAVLRWIYR